MLKLVREPPSLPVSDQSVAVASRLLLVRQSNSSSTRVSCVPSTSTHRASLALGAVEPLRVVKTEPREVWDCQAHLFFSRTRLRRTSIGAKARHDLQKPSSLDLESPLPPRQRDRS